MSTNSVGDNCKQFEYDLTVAVLTYNPKWEEVKRTLESIVRQNNCKIQIIISDDGSKDNKKEEVDDFFRGINYSHYVYLDNRENVGTVKNLIRTLRECHTEYLKILGQGDVLYNENVMSDLLSFCQKRGLDVAFGKVVPFSEKNGIIVRPEMVYYSDICRPNININEYCFVIEEYPLGTSLFFKREVLIKYLYEIEGIVKYCEDLSTRLMLLDNRIIEYYPGYVVFYECSAGVSNNKEYSPRIQNDVRNFSAFFQNRINSSRKKGIRHILRLIKIREKKKEQQSLMRQVFLKILLVLCDVRIVSHKVRSRIIRRKLKNIDTSFLNACIQARGIM